tara:strand:- start:191 stop:430 length:240 start_codon:yes stop_codon:yes gene_type:complete
MGGASRMVKDPRVAAQEEAEKTFELFINLTKKTGWVLGFIAIALVSCNFGVDGTGSKSDPELYEEYKQNMIEMGEKYKK